MNQNNIMAAKDVKYFIIHCSATRCNRNYTVEQLLNDHKARGLPHHRLPLLYTQRWHHDTTPQTARGGRPLRAL